VKVFIRFDTEDLKAIVKKYIEDHNTDQSDIEDPVIDFVVLGVTGGKTDILCEVVLKEPNPLITGPRNGPYR
jgi:hypothetical protein